MLAGKQPRASGGSSVILTGRSDILGGIGLLGGIVTSSNVCTTHQIGIAVITLSAWPLITHVIHVPDGSRGHGEPPAHGHTCRSTRSGGIHMRQYLLLHNTLRGLSTNPKKTEPGKRRRRVRTGPPSENIALGLSSCSCILRAISSLEPIMSARSILCFFSFPFAAFTVSRAEGRYCPRGVDVPDAFFEPCGISVALKQQGVHAGVSGAQ